MVDEEIADKLFRTETIYNNPKNTPDIRSMTRSNLTTIQNSADNSMNPDQVAKIVENPYQTIESRKTINSRTHTNLNDNQPAADTESE